MAVGHGAYHKSCFSCRACQRAIDFYNCVSHKVTKLRQAWLQPLTIQLHGFLGGLTDNHIRMISGLVQPLSKTSCVFSARYTARPASQPISTPARGQSAPPTPLPSAGTPAGGTRVPGALGPSSTQRGWLQAKGITIGSALLASGQFLYQVFLRGSTQGGATGVAGILIKDVIKFSRRI